MSGTPTILRRIADERAADVAELRTVESYDALLQRAKSAPKPRLSFADALRRSGMSMIAEVKRASPSAGLIADIRNPVTVAREYVSGGARAVSVLTEPRHFKGSPEDLQAVAMTGLAPVLRKDFIIDPYQIAEARIWGASAVLLIVALLPTPGELRPLLRAAWDLDLDVLVEAHSEEEVRVAADAGSNIIGINHRNLHTFEVDTTLFERARPALPSSVLTVAESGLQTPADVARMQAAGADGVLIGEQVAKAPDRRAEVERLLSACSGGDA